MTRLRRMGNHITDSDQHLLNCNDITGKSVRG